QSSTLKEDISNSLKSSQIPLVCPQICKEGLNPVISFIPEVNLFISGKENSINCLWLKISVQVTGSAIDTVAFPNFFVKASTHLKELSTTSSISSFNFSGFFFVSLSTFSTGLTAIAVENGPVTLVPTLISGNLSFTFAVFSNKGVRISLL